MTALQPFEFYSHNTNETRKVQINSHQMEELSHTMAETIVDNMSTKDLVRYVPVSYTHLTLPTKRIV